MTEEDGPRGTPPLPRRAMRQATIVNPRGMHARAAARFVRKAALFKSQLWISKGGVAVDGRSVMGILMLAAATGTQIILEAVGSDAESAVTALSTLVETDWEEPTDPAPTPGQI